MTRVSRNTRFEPDALRLLLQVQPFDLALWHCATGDALHLRIGSACPVIGKTDALLELARFMAPVESFGTRFCEAWARAEMIHVETELRIDGRDIPCAIVTRSFSGLLQDIRFYLDPSPVEGGAWWQR